MSYEMVKAVLERESRVSRQHVRVVTRVGKEFFGPIVKLETTYLEMQDFTRGPNPGYPVFVACDDVSSVQMPQDSTG